MNTYGYVGGNPLSRIDPYGKWAAELGFSGSGTFFGVSVTVSIGITFDGKGNVAGYASGGLGGGAGLGEVVGATAQYSPNAQTVSDMRGPFANASGGGGLALGGTIDAFAGTTSDGRNVSGGGITIGEGLGETSFAGGSYTAITPSFNIFGNNGSDKSKLTCSG